MIKYLRYSGMVVSFSINPLYWKVLPHFKNYSEIGDNYSFEFLFLRIQLWIDNGDW